MNARMQIRMRDAGCRCYISSRVLGVHLALVVGAISTVTVVTCSDDAADGLGDDGGGLAHEHLFYDESEKTLL